MRSRQDDPTILFGLFTTILLLGVMVFVLALRNIQPLLVAYRADPECRTGLRAPDTTIAATGGCAVYRSVVSRHWSGYRSRTRYYSVAVVRPDSGLDSLDLVGSHKRRAWDAAVPGAAIVVERFNPPASGSSPHVTAVGLNGSRYETPWNPEYLIAGDTLGAIVCALLAPLFAWLTVRSRRRRALVNRIVTRETYRVTVTVR